MIIFNALNSFGLPFGYALLVLIMMLVVIPLLYGFNRALKERDAFLRNASPSGLNVLSSSAPTAKSLPGWMMKASAATGQNPSQPALVSVTTDAIIANRALGIYHLPDCEWADAVQPKNRIGFATPLAAQKAGYHACKVCAP